MPIEQSIKHYAIEIAGDIEPEELLELIDHLHDISEERKVWTNAEIQRRQRAEEAIRAEYRAEADTRPHQNK